MLFNSIEFALFLPIVFGLYWFVLNRDLKYQNLLLLAASYFFYGWWDWRFLSLIIFSSLADYLIGIELGKNKKQSNRKFLLCISIIINLGFLGFFKYFNFFLDAFIDAFSFFGGSFEGTRLDIILPVGISFYTFQTLSYSIDVYNKKITPTKNLIAFFAYVSFFPQLVAGPIERAKNLLPQFTQKRQFDYMQAKDGLRQILWGLFKKMVVADNCAIYVNDIFANYELYSGNTLILGGVYFAFQIYCDFSGYSDIAIGTSKLFGFNLMQNFAFPYFSKDIAEFWRRWHISLSTWFRDYLYIPLGGSRGGTWMKVRNTFIIFIVSGFWHGANWTFIVWGALNAIYFLPLLLLNLNRKNLEITAKGKNLPSIGNVLNMLLTFGLTVIAWIFFRAENLSHALGYLNRIILTIDFSIPEFLTRNIYPFIIILIIMEWFQRSNEHGLEKLPSSPWIRYSIYYICAFTIIMNHRVEQSFVYFQF